jgi:hypothetical protein
MPARPAGSEAGSEVAAGVVWPASERRRDLSGWFYVAPSLLINCLFLLFPVFARSSPPSLSGGRPSTMRSGP